MSAVKNLTAVGLVGIGLLIIGKNWNESKPTQKEIEQTNGTSSMSYKFVGSILALGGLYLLLKENKK